jgi:predicted nucleotidyltransferase/DNA-binding XRE family transcriptional regulator
VTTSAAATIREARSRARLTQSQLAARAHLAQSVVSAYESRRREPSVEMLRKLVESAGFELALSLTPSSSVSPLRARVQAHRRELVTALQAEGARTVSLFGSVARGDNDGQSDVDLLVDVDDSVGLFALGRMRRVAEQILDNSVDIVPSNSLKPDVRTVVRAEAVLL